MLMPPDTQLVSPCRAAAAVPAHTAPANTQFAFAAAIVQSATPRTSRPVTAMSALALGSSDEPAGAADDLDVPAAAMLQASPIGSLSPRKPPAPRRWAGIPGLSARRPWPELAVGLLHSKVTRTKSVHCHGLIGNQ